MHTVELGKKRFVAGLNWENYEDREKALESVKDYREDGKVSGFLTSGDLFLVYSGEKIKEKAYILVSGFLHLPPGAHSLPLPDGRHWLFIKGTDGGVLLDTVLPESDLYAKALEYVDGEINSLSLEQLREKSLVPYRSADTEKVKKIALGVAAAVLLLMVVYLGTDMLFKKPPKTVAPPPPPQQPVVQQPPPEPPKPPQPVSIDLYACYENYYKEIPGKCGHKPVADYVPCGYLEKVKLPFQYGQVAAFNDSLVYYPVSLAGQFYYTELKPLGRLTFVEEGLSAEIDSNMNFTLQGVVICRK